MFLLITKMLTIENREHSVIKITIVGTLVLDELKKILGVLSRVFSTKKHFAFFVHCNFTEITSEITHLTRYLITWMKENHENLTNYLEASSLIIKSDAIAALFNGVFKIQGPVKPNYVTTNYKLGEDFVVNIMKKYLKNNTV
jgi:phage gp16-like protein